MRQKDYFKGKVIIVTGASSGIGLAAARLFASYGAKLSLAARSIDKLEALAAEICPPEDVLCVKTDVSIEEDCRNLIEKTVEKFGRIDILVNNAGISMRANFNNLDLKVLHSVMDVNFWGTVYCTKFALPYLLETKGSVAGVISITGYSALPGRSGYGASKYAIRGFLDTIRMEHWKDGLHVLVFAPGYTTSNVRNSALLADGSKQGSTPLEEGKLMSAEKCVSYLAKALYRRNSHKILTFLGKALVVVHALFPNFTDRMTLKFMEREGDVPQK